MIIGVAGKGSSGKSTLVAAWVAAFAAQGGVEHRLVVDADPHQSLTGLLGHDGTVSVGALRSDYERRLAAGATIRLGESREAAMEAQMGEQAIQATERGYDFLSLGRWELAGSQCTPNRVLGRALQRLIHRYALVLVDYEAGIEPLGRYADLPLDGLIVVTTPARMSLDVSDRMIQQAHQMQTRPRWIGIVLNRVRADAFARAELRAALARWQDAGHVLLGVVDEAEDEPHTLPPDHPWHTQSARLWAAIPQQHAMEVPEPVSLDAYREQARRYRHLAQAIRDGGPR